MGSGSLQFFMLPEELGAFVRDTMSELGLVVVPGRFGGPSTGGVWSGVGALLARGGRLPDRIYLAPEPSPRARADDPEASDAWLLIDPPRREGGDLVMAWMAAGSKQADSAAVALFDRLKRRLKKRLANPMAVVNVRYGGEGIYRSLWYSPGVAEALAEKRIRRLLQRGVENLEFRPIAP